MELKEIRLKIQSVSNIRKLTSALETLSALKMKKSQKLAMLSRPFAREITHLLQHLEPFMDSRSVPFLRQRKLENILVAVVASDRGFCGSFNQNIFRLAEREIANLEKEAPVAIFPIGKKAISFFKKRNKKIDYNFFGIGDYGELEEIKPISDFLVKAFKENRYQKIYIVWTDFISTFRQKPRIMQLLPIEGNNLKEFFPAADHSHSENEKEYEHEHLVEPSLKMVAHEIIPQLVEYLIYHCILESNASEHSARMTAMRNASDNARNRVTELTLDYNKARQEKITSEVCEISSAAEVVS